jgi:type IV pilus assembly protein PilA
MRNRLGNREDEGFTLVELLVIIIIIGILAGIATTVFMSQRSKAQGATAISDLRNAATAEEAQLIEAGVYSASVATLQTNGLRRSPNTTLGIAVSTSGYCEVAGTGGKYYWFDSAAGGVQRASTVSLTPPATARGVCASNVPSTLS